MSADTLIPIILFDGVNEIALPRHAELHHIAVEGYEVSLLFKASDETETEYRQFYVSFNNAPTDYDQGILRLLTSVEFMDGASLAMVYEVYPYESSALPSTL